MVELVPARQLAPDLWCLDLGFQGHAGVIAAFLVTHPHGHTLIETGPSSTLAALAAGVTAAGARLDEVTRLLVTHVHLDHAGAAGTLLRQLPDARIYVHPRGAAHLVAPERLVNSATRIYGERMDSLWGTVESCPADRVISLADGEEVQCGSHTLRALHTPGHASHHLAFHDADAGSVFTGDVGGVRLAGTSQVRPPTPPPDIDVEAWHRSVDRLRGLAPSFLDLTHFGRFADPGAHFDDLLHRLDALVKWTAERLARGDTPAAMIAALRLASATELHDEGVGDLAEPYELATPSGMTVDGVMRYLTRRPAR